MAQQTGQVAVGAGDLGAAGGQENDMRRLLEHHPRLPKDLRGNVLGVVGDDAAGVDDLEAPAAVLGQAVEPVAGDARLVAHDGAPLADDGVEQRRFSHIRPAHDDH